jgi:hypothetical protein
VRIQKHFIPKAADGTPMPLPAQPRTVFSIFPLSGKPNAQGAFKKAWEVRPNAIRENSGRFSPKGCSIVAEGNALGKHGQDFFALQGQAKREIPRVREQRVRIQKQFHS